MASAVTLRITLKTTLNYCSIALRTSNHRHLSGVATQFEHDGLSSSFTFSSDEDPSQITERTSEDPIYVKGLKTASTTTSSESVSMPMSFMAGSIVGKRFYQKVTTREADDGNGWTVMLDFRTLKTPSKKPLKCPSPALAMAIAAEWNYQEEGLVTAIEGLLKRTNNCELAATDAIAAAAHSVVIAIGIFRGRLNIEEAIELIRLEEDLQVDCWGLVEGGHDVDIADLKVQVSSAAVFLGLSRRN